jgi:hypothetical protein
VAALSAVLAVWTISPHYRPFYFVPLFLSVLVVFVFFLTLSYLSGSLVDYFIQRVAADSRQAQSGSTREEAQAISILLLSYLPAIFLYPVAKSLSLVDFGVYLFYPLGLLIFVWCFLIFHQSLIYLYELPRKIVSRALLRSSAVLVIFPLAALGFTVIVLSGLF